MHDETTARRNTHTHTHKDGNVKDGANTRRDTMKKKAEIMRIFLKRNTKTPVKIVGNKWEKNNGEKRPFLFLFYIIQTNEH